MKLVRTPIDAIWVVESPVVGDERGTFWRGYDRALFAAHGLATHIEQTSISHNPRAGTLRGMHYQVAPHEETKLVRCVRGRVYDVGVDLRPWSTTYCRAFGIELAADQPTALYLGPGIAHGFVTLEDDATLYYQIGAPYEAAAARGVRWDDPVFRIAWPRSPAIISERDRTYPDYVPMPAR